MRRRSLFVVAAVTASSLAVGVGSAVAGAAKLTCHMSLTTTPPSGSAIVPQPTPRGSQYGPVHCGRSVGGGIIGASFTVPETGNTVGKYTEYFKTGSIRGTYKLAPTEAGPISVTTFDSQDWLGTITITGGTGAYSAIKPSRHGVVKCSSPDSVHLSCTEKISESSL